MNKLNNTTWFKAERHPNGKPKSIEAIHERCIVKVSDTIQKRVEFINPETEKKETGWRNVWIYNVRILGGDILQKGEKLVEKLKIYYEISPNELTRILTENRINDFNKDYLFKGREISQKDFNELKIELKELDIAEIKGSVKEKGKTDIGTEWLKDKRQLSLEVETIKETPSDSCNRVISQVKVGKNSITFEYRGDDVTYNTVESEEETWLDRNLGATQVATSSTDSDAYGDLFQWGRLDDGHQDRESDTTETLSDSDDPEHSNFILTSEAPNDWRNPQNDDLWNSPDYTNLIASAKSQGFRVPTETEWEAERESWDTNNAAGAYESPLKLTVAGYRSRSTGSLLNVGTAGRYWSSTVSDTNARYLFFSSTSAVMYSYNRAHGSSVRLIYDESLDKGEVNVTVTPSAQSLSLTQKTPTVTATKNSTITPSAQGLELLQQTPIVEVKAAPVLSVAQVDNKIRLTWTY